MACAAFNFRLYLQQRMTFQIPRYMYMNKIAKEGTTIPQYTILWVISALLQVVYVPKI